jgi:hypothetical protein
MRMERWKPIPDFANYEVSDLGRVRNVKTGRILKANPRTSGHPALRLGAGNPRAVHRLVLLAFLGPAPPGAEARHLNGVKTDNRFENLVWDTRRANMLDRKWHDGTSIYKLAPDDVRQIRLMLAAGVRGWRIARLMKVAPWTIWYVQKGITHEDVVG